MALADNGQRKLMAVIGDEDTCVGFVLGGIGEVNSKGQPNFVVIDRTTPTEAVEEAFKTMLVREDVAILLITQVTANRIRPLVDAVTAVMPAVLEIPSPYDPYDPSKDAILNRARKKVAGDDSQPDQGNYHH